MLKVIGAGLPRTGTLTQKAALEMLGFGPCYHMVNVLGDLSKVEMWRRVLDGELDAAAALEGYTASVDWPGSYHYEALMAAHPDAVVLLSVRDGASWERSMRQTICDALWGESVMGNLARAREYIDPPWRGYTELMGTMWERAGVRADAAPGDLARAMEAYNDSVRERVPAERLIEWTPADGWAPLCERLGVEVPEAPVPRLNDSSAFAGQIIDACLAVLGQWRESQRAAATAPVATAAA